MSTNEIKPVGWRSGLVGLACVGVGVLAAGLFLPRQSLWTDEVAQMSGLSLDAVSMTKWLAGLEEHDFGLPEDRMPPLSYWAEWGWSRAFGLSETPLRWSSVACVAAAIAILFAAARRTWGLGAGVAAALILGTSPNVVVQAVEIRAYALLILTATGTFACLLGYASGPVESRRRYLFGIVACGVAAAYTHFFGLVALGGSMVAATALTLIRRERLTPILVAGAVAAVAAVGLVPFIFQASSISTPAAAISISGRAMDMVRLFYRVFSHPATSVSPVAVGVAGLGLALGITCSPAPKREGGRAATAAALALASGTVVVILAHLAQSFFDAARPSYNVWMLPLVALLMASGLAAQARWVRVVASIGVAMMLGANAYSDAELAIRGDSFAHSPSRPIAERIERLGPGRVALIHDTDDPEAYHIYSPVHYRFGGKVRQYRYVPRPDGGLVRVLEYPKPPVEKPELDPLTLPFDALIVARSEQMGAKDLARQIHEGITPIEAGPVVKALLADAGGWERVEQAVYPSFVGARVDVFRKVHRP